MKDCLVEEFRDLIKESSESIDAEVSLDNEVQRKIIFSKTIKVSGLDLEIAGMPTIDGSVERSKKHSENGESEFEYDSMIRINGATESYGYVIYTRSFDTEEEAIANLKEKEKEIKIG